MTRRPCTVFLRALLFDSVLRPWKRVHVPASSHPSIRIAQKLARRCDAVLTSMPIWRAGTGTSTRNTMRTTPLCTWERRQSDVHTMNHSLSLRACSFRVCLHTSDDSRSCYNSLHFSGPSGGSSVIGSRRVHTPADLDYIPEP
jgi:hypothetical protein